ncbi:DUF4959 domain-containing protein [Sphingobacterium alkalisoli]|uniref:DUF4959 domain-containing protein n=1 Tax=Sphingobacterium alkalisoli TaxID=1874115 RepID=A0A4U0H8C5_9SPHI|nr:DUF4959 domain-containing protein [Sphingobacterium alkalisoli]TJY68117.1 DUF4959 domain-containing protein [Sphingobacterium alkalisoli]GGH08960.1 hypothetical protein GCM10011418_06690 [Sphingobacterium alkalisoli]
MKSTNLKLLYITLASLLLFSCEELERFKPNSDDSNPPGKVTLKTYKALFGGARFFYTLPDDEDLMSIEAVYTNPKGKAFTFAASYFVDSLDVYGFPSSEEYTVQLFAVDRAGNRSEALDVPVIPLEPAFSRVANSMEVKPGFSSFFLDWTNELKQNINVYVDFTFNQDGATRTLTSVFSSNLEEDRRFVNDLFLPPTEKVAVKVRVEDMYGNITETIDKGSISLFEDNKIEKSEWMLPNANDSVGGVPMVFGNALEGRNRYVIDDIIDRGDNLNFMHTGSRGKTGRTADGNMPWNFIIDLGGYYELSRIITVQRHSGGLANIARGQYYRDENVGMYNMYIWDDATSSWEFVSQSKIIVPQGLTELEFVKKGEAGDMAYMYPDEPAYTKPTRWFRYEAVKSFNGNYTLEDANCLSEITLYGKKRN